MLDISAHVNAVADMVHDLRSRQGRILLAIAGAPASGKSTLAEELARRLNRQRCHAVTVSMDGFHLDNRVLDACGLKRRKGAPETFDVYGFSHLIRRMHAGEEVIAPSFDRARDIAIAGAQVVPADCPVVIIEGNYLLFDEPVWSDLAQLWDIAAWMDVPMEDIRARLIQRWLSQGLSRTAATRRAELNDIPNAQRIIARALRPDITLTTRDVR
ncbi:MAG: sugar transporter [Rhodobacteraceae bacterium]|nr:sugar transporter [Paracoccaceae bacterium]